MKELPLLIEISRWRDGFRHIAGVDEVGRGALAGPVFAAAIIFKEYEYSAEVRDSKLLSSNRRNVLSRKLKDKSLDWAIGLASPAEIDRLNILEATLLAMRRALNALRMHPDLVLVDGNALPGSQITEHAIIDGDAKSFTISAASIVAKVERDRYMQTMDTHYPTYGFCRNKGYATREHIGAILKYTSCEQHRYSFLGNILKDSFMK